MKMLPNFGCKRIKSWIKFNFSGYISNLNFEILGWFWIKKKRRRKYFWDHLSNIDSFSASLSRVSGLWKPTTTKRSKEIMFCIYLLHDSSDSQCLRFFHRVFHLCLLANALSRVFDQRLCNLQSSIWMLFASWFAF